MLSSLPPFVLFFVGAIVIAFTRGTVRKLLILAIPLIGGLNLLFGVEPGLHLQFDLLGYTLTPYRADKLSLLFGYLFHLAAFLGFVYALHLGDGTPEGSVAGEVGEDDIVGNASAGLQHVAAMVYAGSALGAVFAGDFITLFIFWELLAISSAFLVWARQSERSYATGFRYLIIHVISGVLLLSGALMLAHETGSIEFGHIGLAGTGAAGWILLLSFGIKAGFPLLHNWITEAYPESTPTGTVFLSAFTTKVAVYALARSFVGTDVLIYIGTAMTFFPIFYAVLENDLRRVLGYSMINQIGFMVAGIGIGTSMAVNGAVAHAFADVIFKGLLFMSMGAVMTMTGRTKGTDLGGIYKTMPFTAGLCIVGASAISAFPLFSAFVTKSMIMVAAIEEHHYVVWLFMLFASAGVLEHAGIKIPFFSFFAHDSGIRAKEPPRNMLIAMSIGAVLCVLIGVFPTQFYTLLPYEMDYHPYDLRHVVTQLQLLAFGALGFITLVKTGVYPDEKRAIHVDAEWFYRKAGPWLVGSVGRAVTRVDVYVRSSVLEFVGLIMHAAKRTHGPVGPLAKSWPTGSMVLWVAILLVAYLLFYL
ncbi:MAG: Na(+)/H(+) antiporter subunit D [Gemmatimonadetes bacterium]|nr:Na(+)/H(+) antiporter subunit D [Gemmatimonadota bacterium]|tara:strand:+ start:16163 stop:17926 length:1764 start_codon:yes stop_codon:yes gene_type:complete